MTLVLLTELFLSLFFSRNKLLPSKPTLFPYTTLFRSSPRARKRRRPLPRAAGGRAHRGPSGTTPRPLHRRRRSSREGRRARSEEHTSELQSPCNLVCRLLLEKKKIGREGLLVSAIVQE